MECFKRRSPRSLLCMMFARFIRHDNLIIAESKVTDAEEEQTDEEWINQFSYADTDPSD